MSSVRSKYDARRAIKGYEEAPEELFLPISGDLQDPMGLSMAILTDSALEKGWEPDGFEQREGYRKTGR